MTQAGETLNYTVSDHVKALHDHMGCFFLDVVIVNNGHIPEEIQKRYAEELAKPVMDDSDRLIELGIKVIRDNIVSYEDNVIRHDTKKVASLLISLITAPPSS